jgi:CubicO group peptidase (beta-lactamase class C family)
MTQHAENRLAALFEEHAPTRRDVVARGALLAASGAAGLLSLPGAAVAQTGDQPDWRFCNKCNAMFFDGYPNKGRCPAGGAHLAQGFHFLMHFDAGKGDGARRQYDWRFCGKCNAMFFDGYPNKGRCAGGDAHNAAGWMFGLVHQSPTGWQQDQWRFCNKCEVLFYDGYPAKGSCAAGGGHVAQGYPFYINYDPGIQDKIANAFHTWLTSNSITNASLAVMQNGSLIGQFGFGNRQSSTVVPIASLTKAITAMCIANLVDAGKLSYTDKVSTRLKSFFTDKNTTIADKRANDITIEHLLRHISGFSFDPVVPPWAAGITNTASADETFAKAALAKNLDRVPGTGMNNYNNVNYALLGMIIKQVTGQTYEAYCRQTVLTPHRFSDVRIGAGVPAMGAFGGWEMSVEQYANFIDSHYRKMSTNADAFMKASFTAQYGLGVALRSTSKGRNIWHFGNWPGGKAPFPPTTPSEFSSYFALWDNELLVVAAYDKSINNTQQVALDSALAKAAGK